MTSRTSNFKKETATDSKQDAEISTLQTTVSNIVVPPNVNWSTQKPTSDVDMDNKAFALRARLEPLACFHLATCSSFRSHLLFFGRHLLFCLKVKVPSSEKCENSTIMYMNNISIRRQMQK